MSCGTLTCSENKDFWKGALWGELCSLESQYGTNPCQFKHHKKYKLHLSDGVQFRTSCSCISFIRPWGSPVLTLLLSHFLSAPPYVPPSIQYFCNVDIHYINLLCSYPPLSWLKDALVSHHSVKSCGTLQGVASTQTFISNLPSKTPTTCQSWRGWKGRWRKMDHVSMLNGRLNQLKLVCST